MAKEKKITKKVQRQLDLLSKYYEIDSENHLINIELHYEKASDLFEMDVVTKGTPKFKREILARISELLESVPENYKVDFSIKVDDYEGIKVDNILDSFKDQLEMFNFQIYKVKSGRMFTAVILTLVSVAILFVRQFLLNQQIIDDSILLTEMLDITAWVFLWEGVSTLFLRSDEYRDVSFRIIDHIKSFALLDKSNKEVAKMESEQIKKEWVNVSRREKTARKTLLIAGAISFATGVITVVNLIPEFFRDQSNYTTFLMSAIAQIVMSVVGIIGGIGACSLYCESGKFQKAVPVVSYIYLIVDILVVGVIGYAIFSEPTTIKEKIAALFAVIISLGASILYFVSYLMLRKAGKENGEEDVYKL